MKKGLLILAMLSYLPALAIDAYFNHGVFFDPDNGTYVETHMLFSAESVEYKKTPEGFQSRIELTYIFEQNGAVKGYSKNIVKSPYISDSLTALVDFLDVQRFTLPAGQYDLNVKLVDLENPEDSAEIKHLITIKSPSDNAFLSSILFLDTVYPAGEKSTVFTRGSMEMIPRISGFQGPNQKKASIYTELYQSEIALGGPEDYIVTYDLINVKSGEPISAYRGYGRHKGKEVQPLLHTWNIEALETGQYLVKVEARDRFNQVIAAQSITMDRHNFVPDADSIGKADMMNTFVGKINKEDSLRQMLYCMRYQANIFEEKYINANWEAGDTTELRRFMYNFWRDRNPIDPESAWKKYHHKIEYVEREFDLGPRRRHACATDRGRVYLLYGKPDTRVERPREPNALPYEIWHYYALPKKQDAKFAFMDPTAVSNDYVLINSNVRGEVVDYAWYMRLSTPQFDRSGNDEPTFNGRVSDPNNLRRDKLNTVGSQALDFWNNPR